MLSTLKMDLQQFFFSTHVFCLKLNAPGIYISFLMVGHCQNRKKLHFLRHFDPYPIVKTLYLFEKNTFFKYVLANISEFLKIF